MATKAKKALEDALAKFATATSDRDTWNARLQERRIVAAGVDITALIRGEEDARMASSNDGALVDAPAIAKAQQAEETAKSHHESLLGELRKSEGALHASGGAAADEKLRELEAALQRTHREAGESGRRVRGVEAPRRDAQGCRARSGDAPRERTRPRDLGPTAGPRRPAVQRDYALSPHLRLEGIDAAGGQRELERL